MAGRHTKVAHAAEARREAAQARALATRLGAVIAEQDARLVRVALLIDEVLIRQERLTPGEVRRFASALKGE